MGCHRNCHIWPCVCGSIPLVQAGMYTAQRHVHMSSCSLHSIKSEETRGVKMFPTKTSRDVGMVDGVSDATGSCMENQLVEKVQEQGGVFCDSVTTRSTFAAFKTHFGYTFTIPTSGNILMRLGSVYQSALLTSTFSEISRLLMHRRFPNVACGQLFNSSCR